MPYNSYLVAIFDTIFKNHPQEFGSSNMLDYTLSLEGKELSLMNKLSEIDLPQGAKFCIEKKKQKTVEPEFADVKLVPKLTKKGYTTEPSLAQLSRMSESELRKIVNFTVKNEHARIVFLNATDVTGMDLDDIIELKPKSVELYEGVTPLPDIGVGLNKPAQITYFAFGIDSTDLEKFEKKVKNWAKRIGVNYVGMNEFDDCLTISVEHF